MHDAGNGRAHWEARVQKGEDLRGRQCPRCGRRWCLKLHRGRAPWILAPCVCLRLHRALLRRSLTGKGSTIGTPPSHRPSVVVGETAECESADVLEQARRRGQGHTIDHTSQAIDDRRGGDVEKGGRKGDPWVRRRAGTDLDLHLLLAVDRLSRGNRLSGQDIFLTLTSNKDPCVTVRLDNCLLRPATASSTATASAATSAATACE